MSELCALMALTALMIIIQTSAICATQIMHPIRINHIIIYSLVKFASVEVLALTIYVKGKIRPIYGGKSLKRNLICWINQKLQISIESLGCFEYICFVKFVGIEL